MSSYSIPFNKPCLTGDEYRYIEEALAAGRISGDGAFTLRCHQALERIIGARKVLLTTSCTHALEMSALLLDLGPGDEVIVPSFAFVSTANAFALRGANLVFADIRSDTLNLDERLLPSLITPRTKAIVVVHYAGVGCEMDSILETAGRIPVVEDNAHGLFGCYRGRPLGSFGCLATLSFHETKNVICGEGGALVINQPELIERAEILREKGTNRARFFRGEVDKYTWVDIGSSYLPSEVLAAFLYAQLEKCELIQARRRSIWRRYRARLESWAVGHGVGLPFVPDPCRQPYHMFYLLLPSMKVRQALIEHLKSRGILAVFHYVPLHTSPMGMRFQERPGQCPVTENISDRLLRLPLYQDLTEEQQDEVIDAIFDFQEI